MYIRVLKVDAFEIGRCAFQIWKGLFHGAEIVVERTIGKHTGEEYMEIRTYPYSPRSFPKGKNKSHFETYGEDYGSYELLKAAMIAYAEELYQSTCLMYDQVDYELFKNIRLHELDYPHRLSHKFVNASKEWQAEKCLIFKTAITDNDKSAIIKTIVEELIKL